MDEEYTKGATAGGLEAQSFICLHDWGCLLRVGGPLGVLGVAAFFSLESSSDVPSLTKICCGCVAERRVGRVPFLRRTTRSIIIIIVRILIKVLMNEGKHVQVYPLVLPSGQQVVELPHCLIRFQYSNILNYWETHSIVYRNSLDCRHSQLESSIPQ